MQWGYEAGSIDMAITCPTIYRTPWRRMENAPRYGRKPITPWSVTPCTPSVPAKTATGTFAGPRIRLAQANETRNASEMTAMNVAGEMKDISRGFGDMCRYPG
ncbi:MAG: hypothetical protein ACLUIQ_09095 [Dialister invisus]